MWSELVHLQSWKVDIFRSAYWHGVDSIAGCSRQQSSSWANAGSSLSNLWTCKTTQVCKRVSNRNKFIIRQFEAAYVTNRGSSVLLSEKFQTCAESLGQKRGPTHECYNKKRNDNWVNRTYSGGWYWLAKLTYMLMGTGTHVMRPALKWFWAQPHIWYGLHQCTCITKTCK